MLGAIGLGLSAASATSSLIGGFKGGKAAEKAGQRNYDAIMAETAENIRRAEMQQDQAYGNTVAGIGGSGVRASSGTPANYLNAMQTEFSNQNEWQQAAGQERADIARQSGADAAKQSRWSGTANAFGQAANIFTNQWWNTANTTGGGVS